ncbi:AcrR family transcriptional regulator [Actinoalloteichus hoggarensis]|uniref:Transposon Tn10 TetC protein n=1 Tax=Actinoalloteichus hoggarensis TaxID=1470176 RepID=A0A221WAU2_9PSEU|nr:TetR/AcrR family transcriptional regulator [Actinoalloteichus hoggarensis]ASO23102.1 Transposon Tn10 TetC protein [Actinoalloteichus hoggarensis]MBB5922707.1 AcrR family transcriptional regulator [Actinoalloteichus hoggarensis]
MSPHGSKARQREETRRLLITLGRELFAERGYHAVGLTEIAAAAGLTKGALYHHFGSKAGLFHAVVDDIAHEVASEVSTVADAEATPWDRLRAGCRAFLTAASDPGRRRILLVDGPAVLGWHEWRLLDEATSAAQLTEALATLVEHGVIEATPVEPLARLLSGAMNEAALWIARSDDPARDLAAANRSLERLLSGLRVDD